MILKPENLTSVSSAFCVGEPDQIEQGEGIEQSLRGSLIGIMIRNGALSCGWRHFDLLDLLVNSTTTSILSVDSFPHLCLMYQIWNEINSTDLSLDSMIWDDDQCYGEEGEMSHGCVLTGCELQCDYGWMGAPVSASHHCHHCVMAGVITLSTHCLWCSNIISWWQWPCKRCCSSSTQLIDKME